MTQTPLAFPLRAGKTLAIFLLLALLAGLASLAGGCAGPEGGSSLPWAQPEPWEQQPRLGVPM
jgi:hypothetical protein